MHCISQRKCLIAGGSNGLGEAVGKFLRRRGDTVVTVQRSEPRYDALHIRADFLCLNIADIAQRLRELNIKFNAVLLSTGIDVRRSWKDETEEEILSQYKVNALAPFLLTRMLIGDGFLEHNSNIVNISSFAAAHGSPKHVGYCMSKAAANSWADSVKTECALCGVQINVLYPGRMRTRHNPTAEVPDKINPSRDPEDVVPAVMYLLDMPPGGMNGGIVDYARG